MRYYVDSEKKVKIFKGKHLLNNTTCLIENHITEMHFFKGLFNIYIYILKRKKLHILIMKKTL